MKITNLTHATGDCNGGGSGGGNEYDNRLEEVSE